MKTIISSLKLVFFTPFYIFLALSLSLNLLLIYYLIFLKTTTLSLLFSTTNSFYAWSSVFLTILTSLFFGISFSLLIYRWQQISTQKAFGGKDFIGCFVGALSMGCPVCGSLLLPILGVAGGLSVFPFQGLELKLMAFFLFSLSILESSKIISNQSCLPKEKPIKFEQGKLLLNFNKNTLSFFLPILILVIVISLPFWPTKYKFNLAQKENQSSLISPKEDIREASSPALEVDSQGLFEQINPRSGYEINAIYGDIGPKLLEVGAIDFEKMKQLYEEAGAPLTDEQIKILTKGSNEKIKITPENSYFLLNFLWAFGLANKNPILDEGPMTKYGADEIGNFASTGGWTLGKKDATQLYSKFEIVKLTQKQQKILEDFAFNSYRPCCSNPTGFPDCNHGMAALGLGEIMANQGASAEEIFEAFKYVNAFWFPQTYFDVATYFKAKEGKDWKDVDGRLVAGQDYSTPQGWQRVRQWLSQNGLLQQAPAGAGGCGV